MIIGSLPRALHRGEEPHSQIILRDVFGVAQLVRAPNRDVAEFALLVRSDLKGRGLGEALLRLMIHYSRSIGILCLSADVLHENAAMLRLSQKLGFEARGCATDRLALHLTLSL
jgi:acetyltransferase